MKKSVSAILALFALGSIQAQERALFLSSPGLSPDASTVYFSYAGDIWKAATHGGVATRVTAMEGLETAPRVSPDGKWLAFSANQFGNNDIFVMSTQGGKVHQLTFNTANDKLDAWGWDSETLYFTSDRANSHTSYKVKITGNTPTRLFTNYFNMTSGLVVTPEGEYIFTNSTESTKQASRKRYKGPNNPDLLGYNPKSRAFKKYTTYEGKDFKPSVDRQGEIYFISDENNGQYNLYRLNNGRKEALTEFKTSIKNPTVSADGSLVVFEKDYRLYSYNPQTGKSQALEIAVNTNDVLEKERSFQVAGHISYFDVSPDGKKLAFISRGALFVSDIKGEFIRQITDGKERALEVKWLKDNKTLLFSQTYQGYQNWFTIRGDGSGELKQHTKDLRNNRDIHFNYNRTKAVYLSGRDEVRLMDLKTKKSKVIVKDEIWAFQNSEPSFSPDGKYVLFTAKRDFEDDIFVYNLATSQAINLTHTGVSEKKPVWSPNGKYIYFASDRTSPSYPLGMQRSNIYRLALDWFERPFKSDKFDELFEEKEDKEDKEEKEEKNKDKNKKDKKEEKLPKVVVNPKGILERIDRVSDQFGYQSGPSVFAKDDKTYLFFNTNQENGKNKLYRKTFEDFKPTESKEIFGKSAYNLILNKGKIYALSGGAIYQFGISSSSPKKIDIKYDFTKNLMSEFHQIFYEAWAGVAENYYDQSFHGVNWKQIKEQYARYLPYVTNRNDLRELLNDMLGELNSSHMGFYSNGKEERKNLDFTTNETGIIFEKQHPYRIDYVVRKSPAFKADIPLKKGDVLVAINDQKVDENINRESYLTTPERQEELKLTFSRNGKIITTKIHPTSIGQLKSLLYDEWVYHNEQRVKTWSNDQIAYVHMKNMSGGSLDQFLLDMVSKKRKKKALILDIRYNTGGNVHDKVLNFLSQRPYLKWKYREGKMTIQPNFAPSGKPIVLLINRYSLSDAEMTAAGFKALKLGKIIGTGTYRWIIFTSGKGLVDGSFYRLPSWGTYTLEGKDLELTGVTPDIYVKNTFLDRIQGKDPQLKRAVQEIMTELKL